MDTNEIDARLERIEAKLDTAYDVASDLNAEIGDALDQLGATNDESLGDALRRSFADLGRDGR